MRNIKNKLLTLSLILSCFNAQAQEVYKSSKSIQEIHLLAGDYYKSNDDKKAVELWKEVVSRDPKHVEAWHNIAVVQEKSFNDKHQAIKTLETALLENPKNAELSSNLAMLLDKTGKSQEALNIINSAIEKHPKDTTLLNTKALTCFSNENYQCAADSLNKLKKINPKYNGLNFNLALAYEKLNKFDLAIIEFEEEIKQSPLNTEAIAKIGDCYNQLQLNDKAIDYYKRAVQIEPNLAWPHYNLGVLTEPNNPDEAIIHYETHLKLQPTNPHAWSNLALIYLAKNEFDKSVKMLKKAIKYGNEPHFYFNLGLALEKTHCEYQAYNEYKTSLKMNPELQAAKKALIKIRSKYNFETNTNLEISKKDLQKLRNKEDKSCRVYSN